MEPTPNRPFGLTLLTALNVGFGVLNLAAAVQLGLALKMKLDPTHLVNFDPAIGVGLGALPLWFIAYELGASVLKAALLLISGWGYFNFKRVAGRLVGTAYALVSLADSAVAFFGISPNLTGATVIGILYPLFTLIAVNGMFKPVLTR